MTGKPVQPAKAAGGYSDTPEAPRAVLASPHGPGNGMWDYPRHGEAEEIAREAYLPPPPPHAVVWTRSHRYETRSRLLADRHYNRRKPGSPQFVPPGRNIVLYAGQPGAEAVWVTSWPFAQYVRHAWAGAWVCSLFRNEGAGRASDLIRAAVAATRAHYGTPPELGMVTFVDRRRVQPTKVRGRDVWGWTYLRAGFHVAGETKKGLLALRLAPADMPPPLDVAA